MIYKLPATMIYILIVTFCFYLSPALYGGNFQGAGENSSGTNAVFQSGANSTSSNGSGSSSSTNSSPSPMTMKDAKEQAESEIIEAPAVYDVTDPALVYSELKPYVEKWRKSLSVPTNEWGVNTSSAVVQSSTRPDYVPAELITFIMGELAKENKAGAFGLDGAAQARKDLADARKDAVDKRANEILEKANKESIEAASTNSSSENSNTADPPSQKPESDGTSESSNEKPHELSSTPMTSASEHSAGIDTDLDGKPDGLEGDESDSKREGHKASFLFDRGGTKTMNLLSPKMENIDERLKRLVANGDTTVYLYLFNQADGENSGYSPYLKNEIGGTLDNSAVEGYRSRIEMIKKADLKIIFWLRADQSMSFNAAKPEQQFKYQEDMVKLFDKDATEWVLGYRLNRYMDESEANDYVAHLKGITSKPVGIHCMGMNNYIWAINSKADVYYGDYGYKCTPSEIKEKTKDVLAKLDGKVKFIAAEYHQSSDTDEAKALGQAAMEAGADGTGNGQ
jgi:hypothetical protein